MNDVIFLDDHGYVWALHERLGKLKCEVDTTTGGGYYCWDIEEAIEELKRGLYIHLADGEEDYISIGTFGTLAEVLEDIAVQGWHAARRQQIIKEVSISLNGANEYEAYILLEESKL